MLNNHLLKIHGQYAIHTMTTWSRYTGNEYCNKHYNCSMVQPQSSQIDDSTYFRECSKNNKVVKVYLQFPSIQLLPYCQC